jgi:hypothetical protein
MKSALRQLARHPFVVAALIYIVANGIRFMWIADSEWEDVFVLAARQLLHGGNIYDILPESKGHAYSYPPLQAMLAIPFLLFSFWTSRFSWMLVNFASLILVWRWSWKASGGKSLETDKRNWPEIAICLLGLVCGMRFVQDNLDHQQTDLVIGALLMGGVLAFQKSRDFLAATVWGIAAAMKGPPLLFAPYLFWRGRWREAIWMVVLVIGLNLLPDLVHRAPSGLWLREWYVSMIQPVDEVGKWHSAPENNQSIAGEAYRLHDSYSPQTLKLAVYGLEFLLLAAAAAIMGRPFSHSIDHRRAALECSLIMILMLLLSPMSSKPHFCVLLLPGFCLGREFIERKSVTAILSIILCVVLVVILDRNVMGGILMNSDRGKLIGERAMWLGSIVWATLGLGIACAAALMDSRRMSRRS